jgi:hypothetical protein
MMNLRDAPEVAAAIARAKLGEVILVHHRGDDVVSAAVLSLGALREVLDASPRFSHGRCLETSFVHPHDRARRLLVVCDEGSGRVGVGSVDGAP